MTQHSTEIAIVGGGVCGLWLLNLLRDAGYDACLLEQGQLGQAQTLASQGMIHGGIKYALGGFKTQASETIASMPTRWRECIAGTGTIDLKGLPVLSDDYYLFSDGNLGAKVTAFFASKSLRGRVTPVDKQDYPPAFQSADFKGNLYRLQDIVVDTSALIRLLAERYRSHIYQARVEVMSNSGTIEHLSVVDAAGHAHEIKARQYIFAAGEGNGALIESLPFPSLKMQLRPLKQVMVKGSLPTLYAHAVSLRDANKPRVTVTTHPLNNGEKVWYLGGNLAEQGVTQSDNELIERTKEELAALFPWIDFSAAEYRTLDVNRAEPAQENHTRPDFPFVQQADNALVCWPTKLTLTPLLGDEVLEKLPAPVKAESSPTLPLASAELSPPPWELAFA